MCCGVSDEVCRLFIEANGTTVDVFCMANGRSREVICPVNTSEDDFIVMVRGSFGSN